MISGGNYTAPNPLLASHTYSIEATSSADPSKSAFATVTAIPLENQVQENFPIALGTSGVNANTQDCCTGTLGSLLVDEQGKQYILSNNHVLGRSGFAATGEAIVQPGLVDAWCDPTTPKTVATFSLAPRWAANVDAAIAEVVPGAVDLKGGIIGLGGVNPDNSYVSAPPAKTIAIAETGMPIAKSGRTTGLTCGVVEGVNGSIKVDLPADCGSQLHQTVLFRGQVIMNGIVKPGDSGSLAVDAGTARPVALVAALSLSGDFSSGNPVGDVINGLSALTKSKLSFVGGAEHSVSCMPAATAGTRFAAQQARPEAASQLGRTELARAMAVQSRYEAKLLTKPSVVGIALGRSLEDSSRAALLVFVDRGRKPPSFPTQLDGVAVRYLATGRFSTGTPAKIQTSQQCRALPFNTNNE